MSEQKPSKESLREVKREYKERRKAEKQREKAAADYWAEQANPGKARTESGKTGVALALGVASVAALAYGAFQHFTGQPTLTSPPNVAAAPTQTADSSAAPRSPSSPAPGNTDPRYEITGAHPSDYSQWGYGAAGLKPPKPEKIGSFTSVQVADALDMTTAYLRAAILMPDVIIGGKIDPVLMTLSDETRQGLIIAHQKSQATRGKSGYDWLTTANRFRPSDWTFKVQPSAMPMASTMKVSKGASIGSLDVMFRVASRYTLLRKKTEVPVGVTIWRNGVLRFYKVDSASVTRPDLVRSGSTIGTEDPTSWDCGNWVDFDYFEVC